MLENASTHELEELARMHTQQEEDSESLPVTELFLTFSLYPFLFLKDSRAI